MNESSGQHDEAEENYFISLSDLMTGVVFIFVILLCAFAFHYQTAQRDADSKAQESESAEARATEAANKAASAETDANEKAQKIDALSKLLRERDGGQAVYPRLSPRLRSVRAVRIGGARSDYSDGAAWRRNHADSLVGAKSEVPHLCTRDRKSVV